MLNSTQTVTISSKELVLPGNGLLWRMSVDTYHALVDTGTFASDEDVELIHGYVVKKMPKNPRHAKANQWLVILLAQMKRIRPNPGVRYPVLKRLECYLFNLYCPKADELQQNPPPQSSLIDPTFSHRPDSQDRSTAVCTLATANASAKPGAPCLPSATDFKNS